MRDVVCMKKHGRRLWGVVGKENCLRKERPHSRELCPTLPPCEPEWFMSHWSECSKSCGTGIKTREVKCLNVSMRASLTCPDKRRPQERRTCNKHSCHADNNNNNSSNLHANDYDPPPPRKVAVPERYQESTSPNTSFQRYNDHHNSRNHTGPAMALQASAPARISLKQDVRNALGDDANEHVRQHPKQRRHHSHRHPNLEERHQAATGSPTTKLATPKHSDGSSSLHSHTPTPTTTTMTSDMADQQTAPTTQQVDPDCTDKPNARWCLVVSQARLCIYSVYQEKCCHTCGKYLLRH